MTVAFEIKRPWPQFTRGEFARSTWGRLYWPTWITIWHVDPELADWFGALSARLRFVRYQHLARKAANIHRAERLGELQ